MAAFSRGLRLLAVPRAPLSATTMTHQQPLLLQTSSRLLFSSLRDSKSPAKPTAKPPAKTPSSTDRNLARAKQPPRPSPSPPATTNPNPSAYALLHQLSQRGSPTLLYEAGSHFWMKLSSWSAATMFYGYAGINWYTMVLHAPPDVGAWVPYAFTAICAASAGFGSYFFVASHNIVRTVRAVPTASLARLPAGANPKTTPVHLEITVKRLLPGKPKVIIAPPHGVELAHRVALPATPYKTAAQERALSRQEQAEAKRQWEYDQRHLMTVPFRHAGKGVRAAWHGVSRALTKSGFTPMRAGGQKLKLDIESGWALEGGRTLDRLVKIGF